MSEIRKTFTQFIKFGMIGVSNVIISYVFYSIAIKLDMHYIIANFIGYVTSICNAFYWNNKWVFTKKTGEIRNIIKAFVKMVISYAGTGIILNSVLLSIWIELLGISDMIAPIFNIIITTLLNFMLNKCWVFKKTNEKGK